MSDKESIYIAEEILIDPNLNSLIISGEVISGFDDELFYVETTRQGLKRVTIGVARFDYPLAKKLDKELNRPIETYFYMKLLGGFYKRSNSTDQWTPSFTAIGKYALVSKTIKGVKVFFTFEGKDDSF